MAKGLSIHIGLNRLDPKHYGGWDGKLEGCLNDARDMMALAKERGFQATTLLDEQATAKRVIDAIGTAAQNLRAGDILFLTYSGHGGQVADTNGDDEDKRDETWCLYDRQLVDDELYGLWSRFEPGTRLLVLSDSCHSGTVARLIQQFSRIVSDPELTEQFGIPTVPEARSGPPVAGRGRSARNVPVDDVAALKGTRRMPPSVELATEKRNKKLYRDIQKASPNGDRTAVGATVLLISGCQDAQLSSDGKKNGLFTQTLKTVWKEGKFKGAYRSFHKQIQENMPMYQQPNFYVVGMPNPAFLRQMPFTV